MNNADIVYLDGDTETMDAKARKILVPMSRSPHSHEALVQALLMARASCAELVLLHAVELNIAGEERGIGRATLVRQLMVETEARLTALAHSMCGDVPFSVVVSDGQPCQIILKMASSLGVSAIVMGSRRRDGFGWLRRDNVQAVMSESSCPVYIVGPMKPAPKETETGWTTPSPIPQIVIQRCP